MIYYRQNKDGSIIDFVEYTANEIIPSFILEQYTPTERTIIELVEGSFVFADTVDMAEVEAERRQKEFETARQVKLQAISEWTEHKITGGFISECTGNPVRYDSDKDTQLTMQGIALNVSTERFANEFPLGCPVRGYKEGETEKTIQYLNAAQVYTWCADLSSHIGACKQQGWIKQAQVGAALSKEDLDAIILD